MTKTNKMSGDNFEKSLFEAGMEYVAKFSAPRAQVQKVLRRRVNRWIRRSADEEDRLLEVSNEAEEAISKVLDKLESLGGINDEAYTKSKIRSFVEVGKGRRHMEMQLKVKGVSPELVKGVLEDTVGEQNSEQALNTEFFSALKFACSRRIGPFAHLSQKKSKPKPGQGIEDFKRTEHGKVMSKFARQGFSFELANRVLKTSLEEAEDVLEQGYHWEE